MKKLIIIISLIVFSQLSFAENIAIIVNPSNDNQLSKEFVRNTKEGNADCPICQKCLCGRQDIQTGEQATRIVGGKASVENEFPWKVLLMPILPIAGEMSEVHQP